MTAPVAVLPAAGASRRMGRPKLLLPFGESTLVGSVVAALRGGGVQEIVLVIAPGDEDLRAWAREAGVRVVVNPDPDRGMLSTIQEGVAALDRTDVPLLVTPADLPNLRAETVALLLQRMRETGAPLALPTHHGKRGHPLAIAPALIPEIGTLDPAIGLRQLRDRHEAELLEVEAGDAGVVEDVDTPEDYARVRART
ncbi:MAG TPA: nucleotidyltransferase family protein [Thermoanaerobaculia bacterium]